MSLRSRPLSTCILACATLLLAATFTAAETPQVIGEHLRSAVLETPHPYPSGDDSNKGLVWSDHFYHPDAGYLVFEFKKFHLAPGDRVEIRDPQRKQVHVYEGKGFKNKGGDFISKMILGPEAYIDLYSKNTDHGYYGYRIERITRGFNRIELEELYGDAYGPEAICGGDDKEDAVCYETSFPDVYEEARAVARIVMDGSALCTAWLVSCQNHVMTNNHCTWDDNDFDTQGELDRMEFQFVYEDPSCGGAGATVEYSFMGGTWLENDHNLDYTLIQAPVTENPAATYGWLLIDNRLVDIDETIYIVGHPDGRPKEISLYSDNAADQDNPDGFCEVSSQSEPACVGGTVGEIGYFCDTEGGSSGSPVLSRVTNKVVALHHCANCPNRGVRIQNIWAMNQAGGSALPLCSLFDYVGRMKLDAELYGCSGTVQIEVRDGSLPGAGTQPVTLWSDTETTPEELTLTETGADTGKFTGSIDLAEVAPVKDDGFLSVAHGDTITVRYIDADDGQGGINVIKEDTATVDCQGPAISNVQATEVQGNAATILWDTDEAADSEMWYRLLAGGWSSTADAELVTAHDVTVSGLTECSDYEYWVRSADEAGNATDEDNGGSYYTFTTGANVRPVYPSADTPLAISNTANTLSTIAVADSENVLDVDVIVNITHTYTGDLDLFLMGPNGVEVELSSDNGGTGENYTGTVFDDDADTPIAAGTAPFTGSFQPEGLLSTFDGVNAAGDWTLRVYDDAGGDTGTLESWSLRLQYPARSCGPHAGYEAHAPQADACSTGGPGDGDTIWDAGEAITFEVTVKNDGTDPMIGISATVVPLTAGIIMTDDQASYPDLAAGATGVSVSPPYTAVFDEALVCGDTLDFQLEISSDQGAWSDTFHQGLGLVVLGDGTALSEDFDAGIPGTWTIVDGGATTDTWFADSAIDPAGCTNTDPALPIAGMWAAADSDCAGSFDMDEELITPVMDLTGAITATLEFDHYFHVFGAEVADVDVRSANTGGLWVNVGQWVVDTANPQHEALDITAHAAGAADVEIRWHYYNANFEWYWYVDNVLVTYTAPGGCNMNVCVGAGTPPGDQTDGHWPDVDTYTWDLDPAATSGYMLYRGDGTNLPALMDSSDDSCTRFTGADETENLVNLAGDSPGLGSLYWYLVTGWNASGEGTAGDATAGTRVVDATGSCGGAP